MTGGSGAKDDPHPFTDEARAMGVDVDDPRAVTWMERHLPEFFVQIWPEAKRRQLKRAVDAYEAALREQARAAGGQASGDDGAPTAR